MIVFRRPSPCTARAVKRTNDRPHRLRCSDVLLSRREAILVVIWRHWESASHFESRERRGHRRRMRPRCIRNNPPLASDGVFPSRRCHRDVRDVIDCSPGLRLKTLGRHSWYCHQIEYSYFTRKTIFC